MPSRCTLPYLLLNCSHSKASNWWCQLEKLVPRGPLFRWPAAVASLSVNYSAITRETSLCFSYFLPVAISAQWKEWSQLGPSSSLLKEKKSPQKKALLQLKKMQLTHRKAIGFCVCVCAAGNYTRCVASLFYAPEAVSLFVGVQKTLRKRLLLSDTFRPPGFSPCLNKQRRKVSFKCQLFSTVYQPMNITHLRECPK